jgi:outer membrane protein TolC
MIRIIMISLCFSLSAFGMSYEKFKQYTLTHAKRLQKQKLSLQATHVKNTILLRSKNPSLNLETSRFIPNQGTTHFGYSVIATQPIRTDNFYDALTYKADANRLLQTAYVTQGKAEYIKNLETLYTEYVYQSKLLSLLKEEYTLSNKVTKIVKERYTDGSENKVAYLQAKTNTLSLKTQMYSTKQALNTRYYQLLAIAGFKKRVTLSKRFIYPVSAKTTLSTKRHPQQKILNAKAKVLESRIRQNNSSIENFELYGGIENVPNQSILRVGINVALPIFNNKSEEKRLAQLQYQQLSLDSEQLDIDIHAKKMMLKSSIQELSNQYYTLKRLIIEQKKLNTLLQEGYKIAQGSIFVMMSAQNKLIQTQKSLLQTEKMINNQKIELRFIQGQYND